MWSGAPKLLDALRLLWWLLGPQKPVHVINIDFENSRGGNSSPPAV